MDIKQIGEKIKERRKLLKVNQPTLASLSGIGLNTLVAIERGTGNPKIETLQALLDTLGLEISITLKK